MSGNAKFRYALEPVLLTRQWDLDALLLDLNRVNSSLLKLKDELDKLDHDIRSAAHDWKQQSAASGHISVGGFTVMTHYMQDLAKQRVFKEQAIANIERERDALIDRVVTAQRGVDAVEQHRDEMKAEFVKLKLSNEFKFADDHWSTLQVRTEHHDN
jgi:chromosome segregation ATPase